MIAFKLASKSFEIRIRSALSLMLEQPVPMAKPIYAALMAP
jgi:hypothetical protein